MEISLLMSTRTLCDGIANRQMESTIQILGRQECFDMEYIMDTENIGGLYDLLNENRHEQACREFSIFLDRNREGSKKRFDQQNFDELNKELEAWIEKESYDIKAILYHNVVYNSKMQILAVGDSEPVRIRASRMIIAAL